MVWVGIILLALETRSLDFLHVLQWSKLLSNQGVGSQRVCHHRCRLPSLCYEDNGPQAVEHLLNGAYARHCKVCVSLTIRNPDRIRLVYTSSGVACTRGLRDPLQATNSFLKSYEESPPRGMALTHRLSNSNGPHDDHLVANPPQPCSAIPILHFFTVLVSL